MGVPQGGNMAGMEKVSFEGVRLNLDVTQAVGTEDIRRYAQNGPDECPECRAKPGTPVLCVRCQISRSAWEWANKLGLAVAMDSKEERNLT